MNKVGETLQDVGAEYGVTTGRKRRCGWLDLVVLKYSNLINGYTSLNITKLDVLDKFKEIEVGVAYKLNGKELPSFPEDLIDLAKVEVVYKKFPGWEQDITGIKNMKTCQKTLRTILNSLKITCKFQSNG